MIKVIDCDGSKQEHINPIAIKVMGWTWDGDDWIGDCQEGCDMDYDWNPFYSDTDYMQLAHILISQGYTVSTVVKEGWASVAIKKDGEYASIGDKADVKVVTCQVLLNILYPSGRIDV